MAKNQKLNLRKARLTDAPQLASLSAELGYPVELVELRARLRQVLKEPGHVVFVANDREPIGWIHACLNRSLEGGTFVEIVGLVVASHRRKMGIGAQLVSIVEEWARKKRSSRIRVRTNVLRREAPLFYLTLGYVSKKKQEVFEKALF